MTEMYDSTDPAQIPPGQDAAGYVDGKWPTFTALHGPSNLSIAVFATDDADTLDIEPGDATNAQAGKWVLHELGLGHWRPCVYTSVSNAGTLIATLKAVGLGRGQYRLWTAHYNYRPHLCTSACGLPAGVTADATQWTDRSGGRNLDESTLADGFFGTQTPTPPPQPSPEGLDNMLMGNDPQGHMVIVGNDKANGNLMVFTETTPGVWSVQDVTDKIKAEAPTDTRTYQIV